VSLLIVISAGGYSVGAHALNPTSGPRSMSKT